MKVYGELVAAQLENLASDPSGVPNGRAYLNTTSHIVKAYINGGWKTMVDTTTAQVITAKDYDGGTASNTSRITLPKAATATLDALTRKEGTMVYDTDTDLVKFDNGSSLLTLATTATAQDSPLDMNNYSLACSVGSSALTIALKDKAGANPSSSSAVNFAFRNATIATGDYAVVSCTSATSIVISSGSTLGHTSAIATYFYVYALNNAGTIELAVSTKLFDDGTVVTTTAEGGAGAADSATAIYSTTARTDKAIRLIARLLSTQATAGTWAAVPTEISLGNDFVTCGVRGRTDGLAVPAGFIGELIEGGPTQDTFTAGTAKTVTSVTLTAGIWDMAASVGMDPKTSAAFTTLSIAISTTTDSLTGTYAKSIAHFIDDDILLENGENWHMTLPRFPVNITSTTTYFLVVKMTGGSGSSHEATGYLTARRVG